MNHIYITKKKEKQMKNKTEMPHIILADWKHVY